MSPHLRFSILLHTLLVLIALTLPITGGGKGGEKGAADGKSKDNEQYEVTIVDPPKNEDEVVVEDEGLEKLKKLAPHAGDKCEKSYGGIGIQDSLGGVIEVYPGYPAARAGIEVGDEIINGEHIRGEVGTPVDIEVMRDLRRITFHMIRDKICIR